LILYQLNKKFQQKDKLSQHIDIIRHSKKLISKKNFYWHFRKRL